ncbi:putative transcription factor bHLH107 [Dioscorea cayenensis subsp. rotundata]|uniref:Transcription factor bHLH107 n=1 Tax=Dioscorea cayennensis subsp. rotundata TaxID=55577 RepID=A0AB40CWP8_DIOCR|nr:putative transcription factor bHLH107 [Dioscorea cayenensis subsp. rotundata]
MFSCFYKEESMKQVESFGMMMMPPDDDDGFTTTSTTSGLPSLVHPHGSSLHPCFEEVYEEEDGTASALRIHSQAEKRRRERINARLSTLRRMIPDSNKMDKASLLGKVIEQVKDLKRKAMDIAKLQTIPSETNEVIVESKGDDKPIMYIKASICCDDRPDLLADLMQAFQGLRVRAVKADMISLGGRVRNVFVLCKKDSQGNVCMNSLKDSIKEVLARIASSDVVSGKRQRLMQSQYTNISF